MAQAGLIDKWQHQFQPNGTCFKRSQQQQHAASKNEPRQLFRLSLKNLSGAFVILVFGITFSITFFIGEHLMFRYCRIQKVIQVKPINNAAAAKPVVVDIKPVETAAKTAFLKADVKPNEPAAAKPTANVVIQVKPVEPAAVINPSLK